jgi:hypothetical protein
VTRTRLPARPGGPRPTAWRAWENYLSSLAPRIIWRHSARRILAGEAPAAGSRPGCPGNGPRIPLFAERSAAPVCYTP